MNYENIIIKSLSLPDLSVSILWQIEELLDMAFHNSHMYTSFREDIEKSHEYFKVLLAFDDENLVWIVVLEDKVHKGIEYYGHPPVHLKRFTVHPEYRSYGIWKMLLDRLKQYAFIECNLKVVFWQSNEVGAISFYLREWALFCIDTIWKYSRRNSCEENISFFKEYIINPKFKKYRYPEGQGLAFIYTNNDTIQKEFQNKSYLNRGELFSH